MTISKYLPLALLALILAGCKSVESVPKNFVLNPQSNQGVLISSVTYRGTYSGYSALFRKVGADEFNELTIGTGTALVPPGMLDWDINRPGLRGNVFAIELPAGDYEMFSWRISSGAATVRPEHNFIIPFKITPGKALYLGNFHFERKGGLGATVIAADVQYKDESIRDLGIVQKKYSGIDPSKVQIYIERSDLGNQLGGSSSATITIPLLVPIR